ncbi:GNAT family N-acetyltransferase [Azoarcus sp. L1K30]|uniref:GNAT family N-acetyltransferase n=1 Tax=Azoarcus sp. L1K30 TaxID=2820277 RepID=UPI001B83F55E|nr:GNAT family N-acetyltransferase [Azoarcus sp. L1K30]MBR0566888.1 GNAT family N-acetyltransferase [Azoarcus sp. L1K30]
MAISKALFSWNGLRSDAYPSHREDMPRQAGSCFSSQTLAMKNIPEIRQAQEDDVSDVAELIYSTSVTCCFTPEQACPDWYRESVQPIQIAKLLKSEQMVWLVAALEQTLVGVLAVSDRSHVKYFFVHPAYQKLGIGKQLWHAALGSGALGDMLTVRSSLFAVPVYESLGFTAIEPPKSFNGMHYQTMVARNG